MVSKLLCPSQLEHCPGRHFPKLILIAPNDEENKTGASDYRTAFLQLEDLSVAKKWLLGIPKSIITSTEIDNTSGNRALGLMAVCHCSPSVAWRTSKASQSAYPSDCPL